MIRKSATQCQNIPHATPRHGPLRHATTTLLFCCTPSLQRGTPSACADECKRLQRFALIIRHVHAPLPRSPELWSPLQPRSSSAPTPLRPALQPRFNPVPAPLQPRLNGTYVIDLSLDFFSSMILQRQASLGYRRGFMGGRGGGNCR